MVAIYILQVCHTLYLFSSCQLYSNAYVHIVGIKRKKKNTQANTLYLYATGKLHLRESASFPKNGSIDTCFHSLI